MIINLILLVIFLIAHISLHELRMAEYSVDLISVLIVVGGRNIAVGVDTPMYVSLFYKLKSTTNFGEFNEYDIAHFGRFFMLFTQTISKFFDSYHSYLIICAIITLFPIGYFIYNNVNNLAIGFSGFLLINGVATSMNIARQMMAIGVAYLGISLWARKKYFVAVIALLVAILFHSSLIIVPLVLVVSLIPYKRVYIFWAVLLGSVLYILYYPLMNIVVKFLPGYSTYLTSIYVIMFSGGKLGSILTFLAILVVSIFVSRYLITSKGETLVTAEVAPSFRLDNISMWFLTFAMAFCIMTLRFSQVQRIAFIFEVIVIYCVPRAIELFEQRSSKIIAQSIYLIVLMIYFLVIQLSRPAWYGVIPYIFWK